METVMPHGSSSPLSAAEGDVSRSRPWLDDDHAESLTRTGKGKARAAAEDDTESPLELNRTPPSIDQGTDLERSHEAQVCLYRHISLIIFTQGMSEYGLYSAGTEAQDDVDERT